MYGVTYRLIDVWGNIQIDRLVGWSGEWIGKLESSLVINFVTAD